jgi:tetratricopeptide (TPR) repeat protein/TolB-like protein
MRLRRAQEDPHLTREDLMIGSTISHYTIIEKLGEGGMGVVYLAEDLKLGRRIALKLLPQEWTKNSQARARFLHEAQTAASLNHPNICTIHEVDESDDRVFLAMEHIDGESLSDRIARGPMKISDIIATGTGIARGLAAAHERGVVHRDIKPGNVMLTMDGRAKVLDFGLALAPEMTRLTRAGRTTGTVSYMSPEQSRGDPVDLRTDIWSLGVVLYEMLTGRRPFAGDHEQAVLLSIINDEPSAPSGLRTGVPLELERIIAKAMAKDPADRYQHVDDMIVDLRGVERSATSGTVATVSSAAPAEVQQAPRSRGFRAAAAVAMVAVVALAAVWVYTGTRRSDRGTTALPGRDVVLVAGFENHSSDPSLDYLSHSLVTALSEGLALMGVVDVVPEQPEAPRSAAPAEHSDGSVRSWLLRSAQEAGATVLVTGSFHVRRDSIRIDARVLEVGDGTAINTIADEAGPSTNPDVAIGKVRSRVMGSLAARADPVLRSGARRYAPIYEAYKEFETGMRYFGARSVVALEHFDRALELDPGLAYVDLFRVGTLSSLGRFAEADSLSRTLRPRLSTLAPRYGLYLDMFDARIRGEREEALRKTRELVRLAPNDFMGRRMLAITALQLNRPREAITNIENLAEDIPATDLYVEVWSYSGLGRAHHMLGEYEDELAVLEEGIESFPDVLWLRSHKVRALAALGRFEDINREIEEASASPAGHGTVGAMLRMAACELRAHGHPREAAAFAERTVQWYLENLETEGATESARYSLGIALYGAGRWDEARTLLVELADENPEEISYRGYLGTLAARAGDVERADAIRESLLTIDEPYDFGFNVFWAACISAQLGRKEEAMEHLRRSYAEGAGLGLHLHQDFDLEPLWDDPAFKRFIAPKD